MQTQQPHFVLSVPNLDQFTWSVAPMTKQQDKRRFLNKLLFMDGWMDGYLNRQAGS